MSEDESTRKNKVIHTRVPEDLDESLRSRAAGLGMSVSNLVRNILVNSVGLVEDAIADSNAVARHARGEGAHAARESSAPNGSIPATSSGPILGWQAMVLNLNAVCAQCNAILPKGAKAAIAIREGLSPRDIICTSCLEALSDDSTHPAP